MSTEVHLRVNGRPVRVTCGPMDRLTTTLRAGLGLIGTKVGCDAGDCGACSVMVDDRVACACLIPTAQVDGGRVETVEGLSASAEGRVLQAAFERHWAAQCGFCTPGMLMAATDLLRHHPQPTTDQIADALGGVLCRCTGYRPIVDAVAAATAELPGSTLPAVGKAVGAAIERLDGHPKVTGTDVFGDDAVPEDAAVVVAVRSPHPRARFTFGDLDQYRDTTVGVLDVMTAADVPGVNRFGVIPPAADQPMLAEGEARFRGEAVALITIEPTPRIDLGDFPVTWEPLDPIRSPAEAAAPGRSRIHPDRPDNVLSRGFVRSGSPDGLNGADPDPDLATISVTGSFQTSFVEHAYIEPEAGWAVVEDGRLIIHATTQAPFMDRDDTAEVLGLDPDRVTIRPTACGGGFGGKLDLSIQPLLGLAALRLGRPVRMTYSRSESMVSTTKRHPASLTATVRASAEGDLRSFDLHGVFDTGAYASWGPTVATRVPIHAGGPYLYPAYRARTEAVHTNQPPGGAFRGFGVPQAAIAQECLFDELADRLGTDGLDFRLRNAIRPGRPTVTGQVFDAGLGYVECLEALREPRRVALARADEHNRSAVGDRWRAGVGLAGAWYGCGNTALPNPSTVLIGIAPDGRILLHQGAVDIGQGANTVMAQICADALDVPLDRIHLIGADTDITPDAGKTSASRQTFITGNATYRAATALVAELVELAGLGRHRGGNGEVGLDVGDGRIEVRVPGRAVTLRLGELPLDDRGYVVSATESYDPPTRPLDENGQGEPYAVFGFGAQVVELRVDTETGFVQLVGIDAAYDVGRAVNPGLLTGQVIGGAAQGIGLALMEEYVPGGNDNLHDYLIPTIGDVPDVRVILIESNDPLGPYGAKGVGEHALIPTAPAILNAIRHATGAAVRRVPATPERVLEAIGRG